MDERNLLFAVLIMAGVTAALRFMPFLLFRSGKTPKIITTLGDTLPYAVMGMLVVYCLKDISFSALSGWAPAVIASVITVLSYIFKRSSLLSIILGTASYMLLINIIIP